MKRRGKKLLVILLAVAIAWQLGTLAASLTFQVQTAQALDQAIAEAQADVAVLEAQIDAASHPASVGNLLRRLGYISPGDLVFFDGGSWFGKAGAAYYDAQK